jgi:NADPH:quinone reductase-like Zn-dependent oxidoreductase
MVPGGLPRAGRAASSGEIHPVVAERLPLADARHAHELLESTAGKLVLVP